MPWEYVPYEDVDLGGALVVVGMPSLRLAGPLAASFLAEVLPCRLVGSFQSDLLPPVTSVRKGIVSSPLQVWASEVACGIDGTCDRLVVVRSEVALPPTQVLPFAGAVTRWASERGVGLLVGLEGFPQKSSVGGRGLVMATSRSAARLAPHIKAEAMDEAVLSGFTAAALMRANRDLVPAIGLFAPTKEGGDVEAAVGLLQALDPLVPNIRFRPEALLERTREIEGALQAERAERASQMRTLNEQYDPSYQ